MNKLPCTECKGKCCTYPVFSNKEYKHVRDKHGLPRGTQSRNFGAMRTLFIENGNCPYLSDSGSCSIYQDRPDTCRKYGMIPQLPCQYLYPDKATAALEALLK